MNIRSLILIPWLILISPAQDQPLIADPARDLFDLATLYYNQGEEDQTNYRLAAKKFDSFIRSHSKHEKAIEAYYFLALSYQKVGEDKAARQCFETIAKREIGGKFLTGATLQLASQDYEAEKWTEAAQWFKILARTAQEKQVRHEALYRRFLCYNELKDEEQTIKALRAILIEPDITYAESARLSLAKIYQKNGNPREAFPYFAKLAKSKDPAIAADATLQAALCAQKVGDPKQSQLWFHAAFQHPGLKKWRGQTQLTLMNFSYQKQDWQSIASYYEAGKFPLKKEANLQRHILAARAYDSLKEEKKALRVYEKIDQLSPNSASGFEAAYRVIIRDHNAQSKHFTHKAESFLRKYGESYSRDQKIHAVRLLLAESYYEKKQYRQAIARFRELNFNLLSHENSLTARYHLTRSLLTIEDHPGALKEIKTFLTKHPKTTQAVKLRLQRAELLTELERDQEALTDYQILLSSQDAKIKSLVLQRLAAIYKNNKEYERFAQTQAEILKLPELSEAMKATAHFWLGWNHYRIKNYHSAISLLNRARAISPKEYRKEVGGLLIRCAYHQENLETLEEEINALKQHDQNAQIPSNILLWLGATLAKKEEYKRAWPLLKQGIQDDSKLLIWRLYVKTALGTSHHQEALTGCDHVLANETHPYRKAEAHFWKSQALTQLKKFIEARESTTTALELRPSGELDTSLRLHAGDIEMAANTPATALRHYIVVESLYAKDPETKKLALEKVIRCLKAINTPESLAKLADYQKKQ